MNKYRMNKYRNELVSLGSEEAINEEVENLLEKHEELREDLMWMKDLTLTSLRRHLHDHYRFQFVAYCCWIEHHHL